MELYPSISGPAWLQPGIIAYTIKLQKIKEIREAFTENTVRQF